MNYLIQKDNKIDPPTKKVTSVQPLQQSSIRQANEIFLEIKKKGGMIKDTPLGTYQGKETGISGKTSRNGWYVDGWKETALFLFVFVCVSHFVFYVLALGIV